jgi:hypothetical protein
MALSSFRSASALAMASVYRHPAWLFAHSLLSLIPISDPDLGFGVGVCADILSHTWPVRGGDQPRTTPMPSQRILTDRSGSLPPKSRDSGTGHLGHQNAAPTPHSRYPTRPSSCAAETTALGPTDAHLGGLPGGGAPAAGALNRGPTPRADPKAPPHDHAGRARC